MGFGHGYIEIIDGKTLKYRGSVPDNRKGEQEVYIVPARDLSLLIDAEEALLPMTKETMPTDLFDVRDGQPIFPDSLELTLKSRGTFKLYLDRGLFGRNKGDQMWVRYESIDNALVEENDELNREK